MLYSYICIIHVCISASANCIPPRIRRGSLLESVTVLIGERLATSAAERDERVKTLDDRLSRELSQLATALKADVEALQAREPAVPVAPMRASEAAVVDTELRGEVEQLRADSRRSELQRTSEQDTWKQWIARIDALVAQLRSEMDGLRDDSRWQKLEHVETQQRVQGEQLERAVSSLVDTDKAVSELSVALGAANAESQKLSTREEELRAEEAKRDAAIEALLLAFRMNLTEQLDAIRAMGNSISTHTAYESLTDTRAQIPVRVYSCRGIERCWW